MMFMSCRDFGPTEALSADCVVVTSVQRKRSVPTVMRSPWTKLYAFSLSVLYKVDLSIVS